VVGLRRSGRPRMRLSGCSKLRPSRAAGRRSRRSPTRSRPREAGRSSTWTATSAPWPIAARWSPRTSSSPI